MDFRDKYFHKGNINFSVGYEGAHFKRYYIAISTDKGAANYNKYYEIDQSIYESCPSNLSVLEKIAEECVNKQRENDFFHPTGNYFDNKQYSAVQTALQWAFEKAKQENDITLILPDLLKSKLYIVVMQDKSGKKSLFTKNSPSPNRLCVTVSEDLDSLERIFWPKEEISGKNLLSLLPHDLEVIFIYGKSGNYLTREHLKLLRQKINN